MPHISKNKLDKRIFDEINKSFVRALIKSGKKESSQFFVSGFFTKTEKIMFAKRLAIIVLLKKGFSYYRIEKLLKVSPSTVARIDNKLSQGGFDVLIKILNIKTEKEMVWEKVEKILRGGLPKYARNRWSS